MNVGEWLRKQASDLAARILKKEQEEKAKRKPKNRPPGVSLAPWREYVDFDNPIERYSNGDWNRIDYIPRRKK
jgi:hypothetical protein